MATPLQKAKKRYLFVTDLVQQVWCEQQLYYSFVLPTVPVEKVEITKGNDLHLARELEVHTKVPVNVSSTEDRWGIKFLNLYDAIGNLLQGVPVCREIPVFGEPYGHGIFMVGIIDEIRVDSETFDFDLIEFKTRSLNSLPSRAQKKTHKLQVSLYKKMFDDLIRGVTTKETITKHLNLNTTKSFGTELLAHMKTSHVQVENLDMLMDIMFDRMKMVPFISQLLVEYCFQTDNSTIGIEAIPYNDAWLEFTVNHLMKFWTGKRDVTGVDIEEAWKCSKCDFEDVCEWRMAKAEECRLKNLQKMHE